MSIKRVLFIDDSKLNAIIDKLRNNLKGKGFTLSESIIDLDLAEFKMDNPEVPGTFILDFKKIKDCILEKYADEPFDLIACDYHFANNTLDGYEILKWIKNESSSKKHRIRRAKFVLYSSEGDKLAEKTKTVEDISKLIRIKFDDFLKREGLADGLTTVLLKEKDTFNFSLSLKRELEKHPEFKFKSVYPKFLDKTLLDIANEIDKDLPNGIDFQKSLLELTIAHLIELNMINEE